jgi:hypothetical protein
VRSDPTKRTDTLPLVLDADAFHNIREPVSFFGLSVTDSRLGISAFQAIMELCSSI